MDIGEIGRWPDLKSKQANKQASKQKQTRKQKKKRYKPKQNAGSCMPVPVMPFTISYLEEILAHTRNLQLPGEMLNYL